VAIHLAESLAERQLLDHHEGPFVDFLSELGVWDADGLIHAPQELFRWYGNVPGTLFVHANHLTPNDSFPLQATVVYCPRTHAAFGHPPHPFREYLAAGLRVALGTDSLASNPDLDVMAEARFLHQRYPEVPGAVLLRMATLAGAEGLGLGSQTGSLVAGKSADVVFLAVEAATPRDPHDLLWASLARIRAMLWRGQWVWRDSPSTWANRSLENPGSPA
jgi:cytosine/adenosine deaminase-related metal-dependent hydrolase